MSSLKPSLPLRAFTPARKPAASPSMRPRYGHHDDEEEVTPRSHAFIQDISAACLFLAAKLSPFPVSPRSTIAVYRFLLSHSSRLSTDVKKPWSDPPTSEEIDAAFLSEGAYFSERQTLHLHESLILRSLSFRTTVHLPYHLALTYLQTLGTLPAPPTSKSRELALRAIQHLNTALLSPQLLYLTHQPHALAVASVYLAARECGVRLVEGEWWEVFDVDREELGFLVMSLRSCEAWMMQEQDRWRGRESSLLRVDSLAEEIRGRKGADSV